MLFVLPTDILILASIVFACIFIKHPLIYLGAFLALLAWVKEGAFKNLKKDNIKKYLYSYEKMVRLNDDTIWRKEVRD